MRIRKLPDVHCLECFEVIPGYLRYFCDKCLKIGEHDERILHEQLQPLP